MAPSPTAKTLVWIIPEVKGAIHSYATTLWPEVREEAARSGFLPLDPLVLDPRQVNLAFVKLNGLKPDLIHIQHEYGLFGRKIPPFYRFPRWVRRLHKRFPEAKIIATAHSVLGPNYRYPIGLSGWKGRFARIANHLLLPFWQKVWGPGTWGRLDGVIVHSRHQEPIVRAAGCPKAVVIPHFVPALPVSAAPAAPAMAAGSTTGLPVIVVFGYITLEKGQDILIRAFARLKTRAKLVIAGGPRRNEDQAYFAHCRRLVRATGIYDRVRFMGFIPDERIDDIYAKATLVVAPFRSTSGSGSLAHAMARGAAVLASDLTLNREIEERMPGCLAFFHAKDFRDCAREIDRLLADGDARKALGAAAKAYADGNSPAAIARKHVEFYRSVIESRPA